MIPHQHIPFKTVYLKTLNSVTNWFQNRLAVLKTSKSHNINHWSSLEGPCSPLNNYYYFFMH